MHEWPLIAFTLLVQGSVGITAALSLFMLFGCKNLTSAEQRRYVLPPLLIAVVAAGLGLCASLLHLGSPLNAFHSLRHYASSWLSREIIFASVYLAIIGFAALLALFMHRLSLVLLLAGAVVGMVDVFCMGGIYVYSSVATWMHANTWFMFFGAAISLGGTVALLAFAARPGMTDCAKYKATLCALGMVIVAALARLVEQLAWFGALAKASLSQVVTFPHQPLIAFEQQLSLYISAWVILAIGIVLQSLFLRAKGSKVLLSAGCAAVILAEILLRLVFFTIN